MKRWEVSVPFTGYKVVEVAAKDEDAAIDAALQSEDLNLSDVSECEWHKHVVQGNVCYATLREAEAVEIGDDEEDEVAS